MNDPNTRYKAAFAELTVRLGRTPRSSDKEWVAIGEELRKAWMQAPAAETLEKPTMTNKPATLEKCYRYGCTNTPVGTSNGDPVCYYHETKEEYLARQSTSAAGTLKDGFSRKLAPQAGALGADSTRARLGGDGGATGGAGISAESDPDRTTGQGASGAARIDERAMAAGARVRAPRVYEGRAGRGPNGGVMAVCEQCGVEWERPMKRGRPAYRCPECRS